MSTIKQIDYGVRTFDLSEERNLQRIETNAEHLAVLESDDTAEIRLGDPNASAIPTRNLETIAIPDEIERIYLSNDPGTGNLTLLFGVKNVQSSVGSPEIEGTIDLQDREAREVGKVRLQDSNGVLVDPATDDTLTDTLSREIANWTAGTLPVDAGTAREISEWSVSDPIDTTATLERAEIVTDVTTDDGEANAAELELGDARDAFDISFEFSSEQTLIVEVSKDAATWRTFKEVTAENGMETEDTAYKHVRAYASADVNHIEISAKGV